MTISEEDVIASILGEGYESYTLEIIPQGYGKSLIEVLATKPPKHDFVDVPPKKSDLFQKARDYIDAEITKAFGIPEGQLTQSMPVQSSPPTENVAYGQYLMALLPPIVRRPSRLTHYSARLEEKNAIGDITCDYNAKSSKLRCAINPSGPCEGCLHHT